MTSFDRIAGGAEEQALELPSSAFGTSGTGFRVVQYAFARWRTATPPPREPDAPAHGEIVYQRIGADRDGGAQAGCGALQRESAPAAE